MTRNEYHEVAFKLQVEGKISDDVFWAILENADVFCDDDEDEDDDWLPQTYAEVEYDDFDSPEAVDGARWDDMNYLRYRER